MEAGAFELPSGGVFFLENDFVVPASRMETRRSFNIYDSDDSSIVAASSGSYRFNPEFTFPSENAVVEQGDSRGFQTGLQSTWQRFLAKARRVVAAISGRA